MRTGNFLVKLGCEPIGALDIVEGDPVVWIDIPDGEGPEHCHRMIRRLIRSAALALQAKSPKGFAVYKDEYEASSVIASALLVEMKSLGSIRDGKARSRIVKVTAREIEDWHTLIWHLHRPPVIPACIPYTIGEIVAAVIRRDGGDDEITQQDWCRE